MKRALSVYSKSILHHHFSSNLKLNPNTHFQSTHKITKTPISSFLSSKMRFFSSENDDSSQQNPNPEPEPESEPNPEPESEPKPEVETSSTHQPKSVEDILAGVEDVSNKDLKLQIEEYFNKGNEEILPTIFESILKRKLIGKHEETDDELMEELRMRPLDDVKDQEFEDDFEEAHSTDSEVDDLYNARDIVMKRMASDEYFNMDDKKWDDMITEATDKGFLRDTKECEEILEDMMNWDKLLPDEIKKKVEKRFKEIEDMVEKGELEVQEGYALFKEFEDEMVLECAKMMQEEELPTFDENDVPDTKKNLDDPPGEGPVLTWHSRAVFAPGGNAWHPKNRKVKLSVTVKELGLSKHQFRRLRELVGKRYSPGSDQLTITSERFEHREENRKDCLRTLFALIEEAGKANKLVEEARSSYVKERLRSNPQFMERLRAKVTQT